jgi:hypothetical protein
VDDQATSLLMTRFYQNLLGKREGLKTATDRPRLNHRATSRLYPPKSNGWISQDFRLELSEGSGRLTGRQTSAPRFRRYCTNILFFVRDLDRLQSGNFNGLR